MNHSQHSNAKQKHICGENMSDRREPRISFSQRNGLAPLPPQLEIGEISPIFRRKISDCFYCQINTRRYLEYPWDSILRDFHIEIRFGVSSDFPIYSSNWTSIFEDIFLTHKFHLVFDYIEFFINHSLTPEDLVDRIILVFEDCRLSYRVFDRVTIAPIGNEEQATAVALAFQDVGAAGMPAAQEHLRSACRHLRDGEFADSVRESIHAVESAAKRIALNGNTLIDCLREIERRGKIHNTLKIAFDKLYAYTSDEHGIRHARVFETVANVDEADALFMLGACASFVSYLVRRA